MITVTNNLNLIGIYTSSKNISVSLMINNDFILRIKKDNKEYNAGIIMFIIQKYLAKFKLSLDNIQLMCVTTGPASFTGVRISIAVAIGIQLIKNIPIISINNFELWKWRFEKENINNVQFNHVLICLNSGNNNINTAIFKKNTNEMKVLATWRKEELIDKLGSTNQIIIIGDCQDIIANTNHHLRLLPKLEPDNLVNWAKEKIVKRVLFQNKLEPFYIHGPRLLTQTNDTIDF
jgi:tRNA threonylcarbamoyl adenosine modification protein YeaZ